MALPAMAIPIATADKGLFLHEWHGGNSQGMIILGLFWYKNEVLNEVNRIQMQYRQEAQHNTQVSCGAPYHRPLRMLKVHVGF